MKKVEKIGYHSNFNFECNTERGFKESLSIALGYPYVSKSHKLQEKGCVSKPLTIKNLNTCFKHNKRTQTKFSCQIIVVQDGSQNVQELIL